MNGLTFLGLRTLHRLRSGPLQDRLLGLEEPVGVTQGVAGGGLEAETRGEGRRIVTQGRDRILVPRQAPDQI